MDPTMVGGLWMKASPEIHKEGVHSIRMYMIEICTLHQLLPVLCGLSLEGTMMKNMQLPEITEGMTLIIAMMESIMSLNHTELINSVITIMPLTTTMNLAVTVILVLIGAKGLEAENVWSFMVNLKTATAALTKVERTAMREIMNMGVTAMIRTMREAGEIVAGEGVAHMRVNVKEEEVMKEMKVHTCAIAVLDHVVMMTDQDHGLDQDLLVQEVVVGTKEMTFMMITALTEEGNMTGMKGGVVIQWYGHNIYILTFVEVSNLQALNFASMLAGPICHCCCQGTTPED